MLLSKRPWGCSLSKLKSSPPRQMSISMYTLCWSLKVVSSLMVKGWSSRLMASFSSRTCCTWPCLPMANFCICLSAWYCPVFLFRTSFTRPYCPDPMVRITWRSENCSFSLASTSLRMWRYSWRLVTCFSKSPRERRHVSRSPCASTVALRVMSAPRKARSPMLLPGPMYTSPFSPGRSTRAWPLRIRKNVSASAPNSTTTSPGWKETGTSACARSSSWCACRALKAGTSPSSATRLRRVAVLRASSNIWALSSRMVAWGLWTMMEYIRGLASRSSSAPKCWRMDSSPMNWHCPYMSLLNLASVPLLTMPKLFGFWPPRAMMSAWLSWRVEKASMTSATCDTSRLWMSSAFRSASIFSVSSSITFCTFGSTGRNASAGMRSARTSLRAIQEALRGSLVRRESTPMTSPTLMTNFSSTPFFRTPTSPSQMM
mmetsp:Transcript_13497/g.28713  ORF Transcript_13497/g.28713 Transcript_13497/m.28713 type:complete len:430 (-) Transcript_13497:808-2097(-)